MRRVPWWVWVSLVAPMGLGAWTPLIPGMQLRRRSWVLWGVLWIAITLAGWVGAALEPDGEGTWAGMCIILGWAGAVATTLAIRPSFMRETSDPFALSRQEAERRLATRREAQKLAAERPDLAYELGVGRPDRDGAHAAGVVDVNNAPASALAELPGVDDALATRIVELRAELDGFKSLPDFLLAVDLDPDLAELLRDRVVFLPR